MYNWARVACGYNLTEIPRKKSWLAQDLISRPLDLYPLGRCDFHSFHHFLTHPIGHLICVQPTVLKVTILLWLQASPSSRSQKSPLACTSTRVGVQLLHLKPHATGTTCYFPLWWRHWSVSFWSIDSASHSFLRLTVFLRKVLIESDRIRQQAENSFKRIPKSGQIFGLEWIRAGAGLSPNPKARAQS